MATLNIKKVAVETTDVGGLKSSRYEKLQVSYGSIASTSYNLGDTLVFSDVPSRDIIRATVVAHTPTPITLEVYPGSDNDSAFSLKLPDNANKPKLSYIVEYVRGTGKVGTALGDDSGEGELFKVIVSKYGTSPATNTTDEEQVPV